MTMLPVFLWYLLAAGEAPGGDPPTVEQVRFFESSMRPVLVEHCQICHGPAKQESDLRMDSLTYRYAGRDFRLTDVEGNVVREIMT